jgi:hypothetical protein
MPWRVALLVLACASLARAGAQPGSEELEASYRFLVTERGAAGGALHVLSAGPLAGIALPYSFVDDAEYWGARVCALPGNACAVTDVYNPADYTLSPQAGPAAALQTERVDVHNGTNIYDAATWQIAVVLGAIDRHYATRPAGAAYALASGENRLLRLGFDGKAAIRATTTPRAFQYQGHRVSDPQRAYAFRMLAPTWLVADPFMGTRYASLITASALPANNPEYRSGMVTWSDWKPLTGENAWALLLGPLQAAYLHYLRGAHQRFVPFDDLAVQNALAVLPTFATLQSALGSVYYAPSGTLANQGAVPVNPHAVSVENNLSLYAGLRVLARTLRAQLEHEPGLGRADRAAIEAALATVAVMIDGGRTPHGAATRGLLAFFRTAAWRSGEFVQGGSADNPGAASGWLPTTQPRAVDVNTWGIAALGAAQLDQWFGFAAAYQAWQAVKQWGGYGAGTTLSGVGYSDQDGNGLGADGRYRQGVLSAEWTAGAINAVRNMIRHYESLAPGAPHYAQAQGMVRSLQQDERTMLAGVQQLRADRYAATAPAPQAPAGRSMVPLPYLYASRRYYIPFGWYANPLPSTSSTAWMLMLADHFDPFGYGGEPN